MIIGDNADNGALLAQSLPMISLQGWDRRLQQVLHRALHAIGLRATHTCEVRPSAHSNWQQQLCNLMGGHALPCPSGFQSSQSVRECTRPAAGLLAAPG